MPKDPGAEKRRADWKKKAERDGGGGRASSLRGLERVHARGQRCRAGVHSTNAPQLKLGKKKGAKKKRAPHRSAGRGFFWCNCWKGLPSLLSTQLHSMQQHRRVGGRAEQGSGGGGPRRHDPSLAGWLAGARLPLRAHVELAINPTLRSAIWGCGGRRFCYLLGLRRWKERQAGGGCCSTGGSSSNSSTGSSLRFPRRVRPGWGSGFSSPSSSHFYFW